MRYLQTRAVYEFLRIPMVLLTARGPSGINRMKESPGRCFEFSEYQYDNRTLRPLLPRNGASAGQGASLRGVALLREVAGTI